MMFLCSLCFHDRFYSEDAAVDNKGIRAMGYTIELRDDGNSGFLLPATEVTLEGGFEGVCVCEGYDMLCTVYTYSTFAVCIQ